MRVIAILTAFMLCCSCIVAAPKPGNSRAAARMIAEADAEIAAWDALAKAVAESSSFSDFKTRFGTWVAAQKERAKDKRHPTARASGGVVQ